MVKVSGSDMMDKAMGRATAKSGKSGTGAAKTGKATAKTPTKPRAEKAAKPAKTAAAKPAKAVAAKPVRAVAAKPEKATAKAPAKTAAKPAKPAGKAAKPAKPAPVETPVTTAIPSAPAAEAQAPVAKLVTSAAPVVTGPEMKKRDLIDRVVKRAGVKKKEAKPVVEAMLAILGEALTDGRDLNLKPLGRLKVTRVKDSGNGRVLICRLRQGGAEGKGAKEALAEPKE